MKKIILFAVLLMAAWCRIKGQGVPISPLMMGQAYHYTQWTDPKQSAIQIFEATGMYTTSVTSAAWSAISTASTMLMRAGGNQYNIGSNKPVSGQEVYYVSIVDNIRKNGCEPVLTLPFTLTTNISQTATAEPNAGTPQYTAAVSASIKTITTILNFVNTVHKRNVQYFIIGNEPDIDYKWKAIAQGGTMTAAQVAQNIAEYIRPISDAAKLVDRTIKLIGPEYTHCLPEVYDLLFTPSNTATYIGGISPVTNLPYLDFISVHFYAANFDKNDYGDSNFYDPTHSGWDARVTFCNLERYKKNSGETGQYARRYRGALRYMKQKCHEVNTDRTANVAGVAQIGFMVTELNSGHNNTFSVSPTTASAAASGTDAISMQGAQNLARMYAMAMEYGAASVMMWSVQEGGNDPLNDRGYLKGSTGDKRPSWFHYKMLGDYFKGTYYRDEILSQYTSAGSGTHDQISDESSSYTLEPNPSWLHKNASSTQTVTLQGTTYTMSNSVNFNDHLEKLLETKAFAAKGNDIAVMILNHSSSDQPVRIVFNGSTTFTAPSNYKRFSFNTTPGFTTALTLSTAAGTGSLAMIAANSTEVLILDCSSPTYVKARYKYQLGAETNTYNTAPTNFFTASSPPVTPTITVTSSSTANCLPNNNCSITVSGFGNSGFSWNKLPNTAVPTASNVLQTVSQGHTVSPGIYEVSVPGPSGCGSFKLQAIVHQNSPLVDAGPDKLSCSAGSVVVGSTVMPTSGQTYVWFPVGGTSYTATIPSSITTSQFFTLEATSASSCTLTDQVYITATPSVDLVIIDSYNDMGTEWNYETYYQDNQVFWDSPAIWSSTVVGGPPVNPSSSANNYFNVMIQNRGCVTASTGLVSYDIYYTKATTGGKWHTAWNSYACSSMTAATCAASLNLFCGGLIGNFTNASPIGPGATATLSDLWYPPSTTAYTCANNPNSPADDNHWCYLAHISHTQDPLPGNLQSVFDQALESNNIAWKNMIIVCPSCKPAQRKNPKGSAVLDNVHQSSQVKISFMSKKDLQERYLGQVSHIYVHMTKNLIFDWVANGSQGNDIEFVNDSVIKITSDSAVMKGISFPSTRSAIMALEIAPTLPVDMAGGQYFRFSVSMGSTNSVSPGGGVEYLIDKTNWLCDSCVDQEENLGSGGDPESREAVLTAIESAAANEQPALFAIPNPNDGLATIYYNLGKGKSGTISIRDARGQLVHQHEVTEATTKVEIDYRELTAGLYFLSLLTENHGIIHQKMVITD